MVVSADNDLIYVWDSYSLQIKFILFKLISGNLQMLKFSLSTNKLVILSDIIVVIDYEQLLNTNNFYI